VRRHEGGTEREGEKAAAHRGKGGKR
jgi:hypothetical protein